MQQPHELCACGHTISLTTAQITIFTHTFSTFHAKHSRYVLLTFLRSHLHTSLRFFCFPFNVFNTFSPPPLGFLGCQNNKYTYRSPQQLHLCQATCIPESTTSWLLWSSTHA